MYFIDPHLRTPYIYQYNLSIQRELIRDTTLEVSYIGSDSHKLTGLVDNNPYILGTNTRLFNAQPGIVNPSAGYEFSYMDTFSNIGKANYNSLVVGLNRRFKDLGPLGAMALQLNFTHGKSIDTESGFRSTTNRVPYYDHDAFRAVSDFDLPNYLNFSANWELPFARAWSKGPKKLTTGWILYPLVTYRSGQALNVRSGISRTATKPGPAADGDPDIVEANLVAPTVYYDPHLVQRGGTGKIGNFYFDTNAFAAPVFSGPGIDPVANPSQRTYGTLGRNAFRGPDRTNLDVSLKKLTSITERVKLEIIGDFFNVLNHAEFNNPTTTITSSTFGQISATADPRILQLAARLTF